MADSQAYRKKFFTGNVVFSGLCLLILLFVYMLAGTLSSAKVDMTADGVYTLSEPTKEVMQELVDKVTVEYFVSSENLPAQFETMVRDTRDMFEEFEDISGGKLEYHIVDPDERAREYAEQKADEYYKAKEEGETPEEPEPVKSIQDIFSGRQGPSQEEIRLQREKTAQARAAAQGRPKDDVYRELLREDFERQYKQKLEQDQIISFPVTESEAGSIRQVRVYSAIKISYLDKQPEVIPVHYLIENLEYELVSRVIKLTTDTKPVVAFFDPRKPEAPPPNPMNPMQQPPSSDYAGIIGALDEFFDIRQITLKKDDAIEDLLAKLKEEKWDRENKDADKEKKEKELDKTVHAEDFALLKGLIVVQPDNLEARQVYEINRAVSLGVPGIILTSRHSLDISRQGLRQGLPILSLQPGSDFEDMLGKWGLELRRELLASDDCGIIEIPRQMGPLMVNAPMPIAACVEASRDGIDQTHALTNRIEGLIFPTTTGFKITKSTMEKAGLDAEVLAKSSPRSWSVQIDPFRNVNNPMMRGQGPTLAQYQRELAEQKPADSLDFIDPVPLAVLVQGKFPFKYQGETVPEWKPKEESPDAAGGGIPGLPGGLPGGLPHGLPGGDNDEALNAHDPDLGGVVELAMAEAESADADEASPAETSSAESEESTPAEASDSSQPEEKSTAATTKTDGEEKKEEPPKANVQPVPGKALFLASADMMKTSFLSQRGGDYQNNINFFYNAIENFGLGDRLIKIRRKQLTSRQFEPGSEKSYKYIIALNLVVVPLLVTGAGVALFLIRRARSVAYERKYLSEHENSGG